MRKGGVACPWDRVRGGLIGGCGQLSLAEGEHLCRGVQLVAAWVAGVVRVAPVFAPL